MATSGSIDFSVSRDDIITESLMLLGVLGEGGTPTSNQLTDHSRSLNMMVKAWLARGINLWAIEKVTVFLEEDKQAYVFGTDHVSITSDVVRTQLAAAAASGATAVTVDSITGLAASDNVGVELSDGTMQWTTINGAPSGTTVTLTAALTGAASTDGRLYAYTTKYNKGAKYVIEGYRRTEELDDTPLTIVSRQEYNLFADKDGDGLVHSIWVERPLSNNLRVTVYPESSSETDVLELTVYRTLEDFDAAANTPDFPQEFYEALVYGLTDRLANYYGKPLSERSYYHVLAEEKLTLAEGFDKELETSVFLSPMLR